MVHRFYTEPQIARNLTKESKKNRFYFRTLSRTDHTNSVYCETTEVGFNYVLDNNIQVKWGK